MANLKSLTEAATEEIVCLKTIVPLVRDALARGQWDGTAATATVAAEQRRDEALRAARAGGPMDESLSAMAARDPESAEALRRLAREAEEIRRDAADLFAQTTAAYAAAEERLRRAEKVVRTKAWRGAPSTR